MRIVKIYFYEYFTILSKNVLKYMNIRILLFGGLVCFFGACNNNVKQTKQETILFEPLSVDGLIIGQAYGMMVDGKNLLIADRMADSLFYWVDLDCLTYREVVSRGQGPNEYLRFDNFYYLQGQHGFYDSRLWCCTDIDFSDKGLVLKKRKTFSSLNYSLVPTSFETYIGIGPYEQGRFKILDSFGKEVSMACEQPYRDNAERNIPELARAMAYQGNILISPDGKRLVHAIFMTPMLSFYQLSADSISEIRTLVDCYPAYKPELSGDSYAAAMSRHNKLGYINIAVTKKYIYALYSGKTTVEHALSAFHGNAVRVYDWEGNFLKEFIFDIDVSSICVSDDDTMLYAVGLVDDFELLSCKIKV